MLFIREKKKKNGEGIKQKNKEEVRLKDTDNSMVTAREKGGWGEVEE